MTTVLVINHGTTTSTSGKPKNLLSELCKGQDCYKSQSRKIWLHRSNNNAVITYPGFGTDEFGDVWKNRPIQAEARPKHSSTVEMAFAALYMSEAAGWLYDDLNEVTGGNREQVKDIIFIGWSRGAILTWFQIHNLAKDRMFGPAAGVEFHVLAIDPSYGPAYERKAIARAQTYASKVWEISMLFQTGPWGPLNIKGSLLTAYPSNNPHRRFFLPGRHDSVVESDKYGDVKQIGQALVGEFLQSTPWGGKALYHRLSHRAYREVFARCKMVDKSWNYSKCFRPYVKDNYTKYKANKNWEKCGFFYNSDDYKTLRKHYKHIVKAFLHDPYDYRELKRQYSRMRRHENAVAKSIWLWADYKHINVLHKLPKEARSYIKSHKP